MISPGFPFFLCSLVLLASSSVVTASSFYDNPEQDPIPEEGTPLDELQRKWSTDVRFMTLSFSFFLLYLYDFGS